MALSIIQIFRDYIVDGVPSSGKNKPKKSDVRNWGSWVESIISSFLSNGGGLVYTSRAVLFADLAHAANSSAWVIGDATTAYNGVYLKNGASGTGSWTRVADLPYSFVKLSDVGAGTANAIQLTSATPTSQSVLRIANVFEANAGNVTISENGDAAKSLLTNSGNQIAAAGLVAGMMIAYIDNGTSFRLLSDQASAAIQAASEAAAAAAEAARDVAVSAAATVKPLPPQGRLTLLSGVAVTEADVAGATTIYYTPAGGNLVPIYGGSSFSPLGFSELSLPLDSNSGHTGYQTSGAIYDLFVVSDGGTLRLGTGPSWASGAVAGSAVARGTGTGSTDLIWVGGIALNANAMTLRYGNGTSDTVAVAAQRATYVGSFKTTANGQATDSKAKRFLFNAFNQVARVLSVKDTTTSWNYNTLAFRQARASSANQVEILLGLSGSLAHLEASATASNSAAAFQSVMTGVGVDSTSVNSARAGVASCSNAANAAPHAAYDGNPGQGYHYLAWLERGAGPTDNQTWYGSVGDIATGLTGWLVI